MKIDKINLSNQTDFVPNPTIPVIVDRNREPWVKFGETNLYPSYISELYNKSAINRRCLQSKITGVYGRGLKTIDVAQEYVLNRANDKGESWNDVFYSLVSDYLIYGGFALHIVWNGTRDRIINFYHRPFESVRSGKVIDETDSVEKYYVSGDWARTRNFTPKEFHKFDKNAAEEFPEQILYYFDYAPGVMYYPLPTYCGSLQDITIDVEVSNFHLSNLANGLNPSLWINFNTGVPDERAAQNLYSGITDAFSGTQNTGKVFITHSQDKEHAPEITPITAANDDYYVNLETRITSRILSGHGITSPLLMGLSVGSSSLGSNKDEILVAYEHFQTTILEPDIRALLKPMNMLMENSGYSSKLYIEPLQLFAAGKTETETT